MNYVAKFIPGITVKEIEAEIERMNYNEYAYGIKPNRPRLWDLLETKKQLERG